MLPGDKVEPLLRAIGLPLGLAADAPPLDAVKFLLRIDCRLPPARGGQVSQKDMRVQSSWQAVKLADRVSHGWS